MRNINHVIDLMVTYGPSEALAQLSGSMLLTKCLQALVCALSVDKNGLD